MTDNITINLKQLNLVIPWRFDGANTECSLCRRSLQAPSLQELNPGDGKPIMIDGEIVVGECKHLFHKSCMNHLLNTDCASCPIDKTPWKKKKNLRSGTMYRTSTISMKASS